MFLETNIRFDEVIGDNDDIGGIPYCRCRATNIGEYHLHYQYREGVHIQYLRKPGITISQLTPPTLPVDSPDGNRS